MLFDVKFSIIYFCLLCRKVCLLRGKVISKSGQPLIGVRVSHEEHLEEGFTLTRSDGMFDFVCSCSSTLVKLKFGKSPFPYIEEAYTLIPNRVSCCIK
jgi:hypothetical protein